MHAFRVGGGAFLFWRRVYPILVGLWIVANWPAQAGAADPLSGLDYRPPNFSCVAGPRPTPASGVRLQPVFPHLTPYRPFFLQQSPVDHSTWYFGTRDAKIYAFAPPNGTPELVLDASDRVGVLSWDNAYAPGGSEQWGLSSFAFAPDFATSGKIFLAINGREATDTSAVSMVMRYTLVRTPTGFGRMFDRSTARMVLYQRQENGMVHHHFGQILFGPDGLLYIGSGDGTTPGPAYLPYIHSQDCTDLRGKILRIAISTADTGVSYAIPAGNPYVGNPVCRQEIFASGFRNPWRFSIDSLTGQLWVGDVGASTWEEVDLVGPGGNYGWPIREGHDCLLGTPEQCARSDLIGPIAVTAHAGQSAAVIGGFLYRGPAMPALNGDYIYSVFPRPDLLALRLGTDGVYRQRTLLSGIPSFSSYFLDTSGEIYGITGHSPTPQIYKLVPDPGASTPVGVTPLLSATGCFVRDPGQITPRVFNGAIPYEVISPLWSDGAQKRRWLGLPYNAKVGIKPDGDFEFPPGTVLIKEFSFLGRPVETRLLKRHDDGVWQGYTYAWRDDLSDADLVPEDGAVRLVADSPTSVLQWAYPSRSQCLQCHTQAAGYALGPEVLQLNSVMSQPYPQTGRLGNQLSSWAAVGVFDRPLPRPVGLLPALVNPADGRHSMIQRARSYLHANCSGCHRPGGPTGKTIDFRYATSTQAMRVCNARQTAGDIDYPGAAILTPLNPSLSAISLRMHALGTGQMPPIARTKEDALGTAVMDAWINRPDVCAIVGDIDKDGVPDNTDNCIYRYNPNQSDKDGDRYGDRCDGDWNSNLVTDQADREALLARKGIEFMRSSLWLDKYDLNGDGVINDLDINFLTDDLLNKRVGPSALRP